MRRKLPQEVSKIGIETFKQVEEYIEEWTNNGSLPGSLCAQA